MGASIKTWLETDRNAVLGESDARFAARLPLHARVRPEGIDAKMSGSTDFDSTRRRSYNHFGQASPERHLSETQERQHG